MIDLLVDIAEDFQSYPDEQILSFGLFYGLDIPLPKKLMQRRKRSSEQLTLKRSKRFKVTVSPSNQADQEDESFSVKTEIKSEFPRSEDSLSDSSFLKTITWKHLEEVAKILRGLYNATSNCIYLAEGLLNYLKNQLMPKNPAPTVGNLLEDFQVTLWITGPEKSELTGKKKNKKLKVEKLNRAVVQRGGLFESFLPEQSFFQITLDDSGDSISEREVIDFTQPYHQMRVTWDTLEQSLQTIAHQQPDGISYGMVNLGRREEELGHMMVYWVKDEKVAVIDAQQIEQGKGKAVFTVEEVKKIYRGKEFFEEVFLIPSR